MLLQWVSLNRSPSHKVLDILDISRHGDGDGRPQSTQPFLGTASNKNQALLHPAARQRIRGKQGGGSCEVVCALCLLGFVFSSN